MTDPDEPRLPRASARAWFALALVLMIGWVALLALIRRSGDAAPEQDEPPILGRPTIATQSSYAWTVRDLDDKPVSFDRFRGRPILLNIWATWCRPCLREMPSLARLAADPRVKAAGVEVVCVATDESPEALRRYVEAKGRGWPMTVLRALDIPAEFSAAGIPTTFLVAADGRIVATHLGSARWDEPSVVDALELLARPTPEPGG